MNLEKRNGTLTRRDMFSRPLAWLNGKPDLSEKDEPVPGRIPLHSLKDIPDNILMRMVPVLRHGWTVGICDEGLAFINDDGEEGTVPLGREGCEATRFFDGARTLAEAAVALGIELEIAQQNSTSIAKEAFLQLVKHDAYHPNDPHLPYPIPEEDQYA